MPEFVTTVSDDEDFQFNSCFESGNLRKAYKVRDNEYNLLLRFDIQTQSYSQWYYFSVKSTKAETVKFNILNFIKYDSLYNEGMQPLVLSEFTSRTKR
jgi:hypothetical protein